MDTWDIARLVHGCADPAFAIDGDFRVVAWNHPAEVLLGKPAARMVGRPCYRALQATTPGGRPLCSSACPARGTVHERRPWQPVEIVCPRCCGPPVRATLSTMALPPDSGAAAIVFVRPPAQPAARLPDTGRLRVYALGRLRLVREGVELPWQAWPRKQAVALFRCLFARRGAPVHREVLIADLWPDATLADGLARLKVVVSDLRRYLAAGVPARAGPGPGAEVISRRGPCYALEPAHVWTDADAFRHLMRSGERLARQGDTPRALRAFEAAEALYRGDLLEDDPYFEPAAAERQALAEGYLDLLERMAALYAATRAHERGLAVCRKGLARDPLREGLVRALMRHLDAAGRRGEAVREYLAFRAALERELGASPAQETVELYERIRGGTVIALHPAR